MFIVLQYVYFHLLPHQFSVAIKGGCKAMVHGIHVTLNVHPDWVVLQVDVVNTFNTISCNLPYFRSFK
jgi:hypothetical protein